MNFVRAIPPSRGSTSAGLGALLAGLLATVAGCAENLIQLGSLTGATQQLGALAPSPTALLQGEPPITTSLSDATFGVDLAEPRDPRGFRPLISLARTPRGGFLLEAGLYEMHTQSYCLKAGTHGPGGGDGYLFAPPLGPARDAVVAIVRNSAQRPELEQHDIQVLLWAIIARAKFEDLEGRLKLLATQLLSADQLALLNRTALDLVPGPALERALASVPTPVREVLAAEASLRQMLTNQTATFQQIEAVAVLAGAAPWGAGSQQVSRGRWSKHPDGYFVRYLPLSYSHTLTQIWVPEKSPGVGQEYDPALHIAVPGNTSQQRLIQSARAHAR